ncbi:MAG: hypothetical protein ACRDVZ_09030, partial [Jiangellaceae bacterium]
VRTETRVDAVLGSPPGFVPDVVALGRAVNAAKRERVIAAIRSRNPHLRVVDGMAPITALLVAQVQEAITVPDSAERLVERAMFESAGNRVVLHLSRAALVEVTMHRLDPLYRAHELRVFDGQLGPGRHNLPIAGRVGRGERYVVVRGDGQTAVRREG